MRWDMHDADRRRAYQGAIANAVRRVQRPRARARIRPAGQQRASNLLASCGMVAGLLLFWMMAINL
jgi:hypothetical protein